MKTQRETQLVGVALGSSPATLAGHITSLSLLPDPKVDFVCMCVCDKVLLGGLGWPAPSFVALELIDSPVSVS